MLHLNCKVSNKDWKRRLTLIEKCDAEAHYSNGKLWYKDYPYDRKINNYGNSTNGITILMNSNLNARKLHISSAQEPTYVRAVETQLSLILNMLNR